MKSRILKIMRMFVKIFFFLALAYLPLNKLSVKNYSIWTDFTGSFNLITEPVKYFQGYIENGFGRYFANPSSYIYFIFLKVLYLLFNQKVAMFLSFYITILITLILTYLLIKEILKKQYSFITFLCLVLIFTYSPVYLYHTIEVATLTFTMSINGLILFFFLYEKYRSTNKIIYLYSIPLASLLIIHPFIFVFYFIILFYFFIIDNKIKQFFLVAFFIIILNSYWIIPFTISFVLQSSKVILNESTNSLIAINTTYSQLVKSFIFAPRSSALNILPSYLGEFSFPIIIGYLTIWIITIKNIMLKPDRRVVFLFFLNLIITLFSLGPTRPIGGAFGWLLSNFHFFSFFRTFSNANLINLSLTLYIFLLSIKTISNKNMKLLSCYLFAFAVILSFSTLKLFVANKSNTNLKIPKEYFLLQTYINKQNSDFYILYLPYTPYKEYSWGNMKGGLNIIYEFFNRGIITNYEGEDYTLKKEGEINAVFKYNRNIPQYLGNNSVKYVIYDKSLVTNYSYQKGSENYLKVLSDLSKTGLKQVITNNFFNVYKVDDNIFFPPIKGKNIKYQRINSTKYSIRATFTKDVAIDLNTNYNDNWNMYLQENDSLNCKNEVYSNKIINLKECGPYRTQFSTMNELNFLFRKSDFDNIKDVHVKFPINHWHISQTAINKSVNLDQLKKEGYPKKNKDGSIDWKYYIINPNGSTTVNLTLYYKNISYYLLTLIASIIFALFLATLVVMKIIRQTKD